LIACRQPSHQLRGHPVWPFASESWQNRVFSFLVNLDDTCPNAASPRPTKPSANGVGRLGRITPIGCGAVALSLGTNSVPLNDMLTTILEEVRITSTATRSVFYSRKGIPYRSFRTAFERAVRGAVIPDFTVHDLQHTFASCLVMADVELSTVQELMGYKAITMTLQYTHHSSDHKRSAVRTLERFGIESRQFLRQDEICEVGTSRKLLKILLPP
jgi:integrase-like protein